MPQPITQLPPDYQEKLYLPLLEGRRALWINLAALLPLAAGLLLVGGWWALLQNQRGPRPGGPDWPWWLWLLLIVVVVLPLHELLHGLAIRWAGHRPRYGLLLSKAALYATADGAYFPRDVFIVIALAPLVGITLGGMALMALLPDGVAYNIGLAVIFNAASAIGDLWMTAVALRYPRSALVRDEMDSIRVFAR